MEGLIIEQAWGKREGAGPESLGEERREEQECAQKWKPRAQRLMVLPCPCARRKWETCFPERPAWVAGGTDYSFP